MTETQEPRRSVRSTKGQHKSHELLDALSIIPAKRQTRKSRKAREAEEIEAAHSSPPAEESKRGRAKRGKANVKEAVEEEEQDEGKDSGEEEEEEEEVIRCVCDVTEQDEDSNEPWIACDQCGVWQHNVCMDMSVYSEDLPNQYFCEQCNPSDHKVLLDGMARGEKPWEARRAAYAEKKKKGRRGRRKTIVEVVLSPASRDTNASHVPESSPSESLSQDNTLATTTLDQAPSGESPTRSSKRKTRDHSPGPDSSERNTKPFQTLSLEPLHPSRQGPVKALKKSLLAVLATVAQKVQYKLGDADETAQQLALEIEQAVYTTHPTQKEYASQCRSLTFNLKSNEELTRGLLTGAMTPSTLATMESDEMATKELQRETAEMKARAVKQSILISESLPRVRRTHKGEEIIEGDSFVGSESINPAFIRRDGSQSPAEKSSPTSPKFASGTATSETNESSQRHEDIKIKSPDDAFDINQVYYTHVQPASPRHSKEPPTPVSASSPGVDADVDRLLDSVDISMSGVAERPTSIIWQGPLTMHGVGATNVVATFAGGCQWSKAHGQPWSGLIPASLAVAGRIDQQKAVQYLCGLRHNDYTDIVVTAITPSSPDNQAEFDAILDYFVSKKRYGVIGEKAHANVRDTYLVPVLPGKGNFPEFMYNITDNFIPYERTSSILLVVFVFRDEERRMAALSPNVANVSSSFPPPSTSPSASSGPAISSAAPSTAPPPSLVPPTTTPSDDYDPNYPMAESTTTNNAASVREQKQAEGETLARAILGPYLYVPTMQFLRPQAWQMSRREWEVIREIYDADPVARNDLQHLSSVLEQRHRMMQA